MTTNLPAGLLRSNGTGCILGAVANGGLEMVGANLSVVDGDTVGQVLRWNGTTWLPRLIIFHGGGGVDTVYNGLTDRDTAFVLGGPLTEHTTITGQLAYDLTWNNLRNIAFEGQRSGGVSYTIFTMGSAEASGVNFFHVKEADPTNQAFQKINYSDGNNMSVKKGSYITSFQQYDAGGYNYQTDISAGDGATAKSICLNKNDSSFLYLSPMDVYNEGAFVMWDTITGVLKYKSPADFTGLYGDNWGAQTVSTTARLSGNGTAGSPLDIARQSATSGQVLKWNGSTWAPASDAGATAENLTAASPKVTVAGGTGAVLSAATVDVNEANLSLNNIGGVLGYAKGGTGLSTLGGIGSVLASNGTGIQYLTPAVTTAASAIAFARSGNFLNLNLPDASISVRGTVSTGSQSLAGSKQFTSRLTAADGLWCYPTTSTNAAIDITGVVDGTFHAIATNTTLNNAYNLVLVSSLSNDITISLPACNISTDGWEYRFVKNGADAFDAILDPNGAQTFTDGSATKTIRGQYASAVCKCWYNGFSGSWMYMPTLAPSTILTTATNFGGDISGTYDNLQLSANAVTPVELQNTSVAAGTYGGQNKFTSLVIDEDGRAISATESAFNMTTYAGVIGGSTVTWQVDDYVVEADPTNGDLTVELAGLVEGRIYHLFGCCNLTNDIVLSGANMKFSGAYGPTSSPYTLGPGEHLKIVYRSSNTTYYISKE
jgi:hypothetical protein